MSQEDAKNQMSDDSVTNSQDNQNPDAQKDAGAASAAPEGLPEAFWDADAKAVKTDDLVKSYADLNKFKSEYDASLAKRPESPEKYEIALPEDFEMPEGFGFEFQPDSDLAKLGRDLAFAKGLDQEGFVKEILTPYVQHEIAKAQKEATDAEEFYKTQKAELGEKADERLAAVDSFLKAKLTEDEYKAFDQVATTKAGVEAIEKLIALTGGPKVQTTGNGAAPDAITQEKLTEMQNDPRYLTDPAFHKQVADGYAKLYPGKQQRIA